MSPLLPIAPLRGLILAALLGLVVAPSAQASHFRYAHVFWEPSPDVEAAPNTVEFTVQTAWRRDFPCVQPLADRCEFIACSAPDGLPAVGDIVVESTGGAVLFTGDGTEIGSPCGGLLLEVTSVDLRNDWIFTEALDPGSLPDVDLTIEHTYPSAGFFTAGIDDCCRVGLHDDGVSHINNANGRYRVETKVGVGTGNSAPRSALPPIVECGKTNVCSFVVPTGDPDGGTVRLRMATSAEAAGSTSSFHQPGPPVAPDSASIDPETGIYTWDTRDATLGDETTFYSTQVVLEEFDNEGRVIASSSLDFFILLDICGAGVAPELTTSIGCDREVVVEMGDEICFDVLSSDFDLGEQVALTGVGLPAGATLSPPLPQVGNPVSSRFCWTPERNAIGSRVITFNAADNCDEQSGRQSACSVTLRVIEDCGNGQDDDGDGAIDCADEDCLSCASGSACQPKRCDDGLLCTLDTCDDSARECRHSPQNSVCSDGVFCNGPERCNPVAGCEATEPPEIDDGVECTLDFCDEANNTVVNFQRHDLCSDGLFCNGEEVCDPSLGCSPVAFSIDDGVGCTVDSCDEEADIVHHDPIDAVCDNGIFCDGAERCDTREDCVPADRAVADDGVECTVDLCDNDTQETSNVPSDALCDDTRFCNGEETCDPQGGCQAGEPVDCQDEFFCTADACVETDRACRTILVHAACDDGLTCSGVESCAIGQGCVDGQATDCSDLDVGCLQGVCREPNGSCETAAVATGTPCDDGEICTVNDGCLDGVCDGDPPLIGAMCPWGVVASAGQRTRTRDHATFTADVCVGLADFGRFASINGNVTSSEEAARTALTFRDAVTISGDASTGGAIISGKPGASRLPGTNQTRIESGVRINKEPAGSYDTTGTDPRVAQCRSAQGELDRLVDRIEALQSIRSIDARRVSGELVVAATQPGLNVIDMERLVLGTESTLALDAAGHENVTFVLRVAKRINMMRGSSIQARGGLSPENVLIFDRRSCRIGEDAEGIGTLLCPFASVRLRLRARWTGALFGGDPKLGLGDTVELRHAPFIGL